MSSDYSAARSAVRSLANDDFVTKNHFVSTTAKTVAKTTAYDEITEPTYVTFPAEVTKPSLASHRQMSPIARCACLRPDPASLGSGIMVCRHCLETIVPREGRSDPGR